MAAARSSSASSTASCCAASCRNPARTSSGRRATCWRSSRAARRSRVRGRAGTDLTLRVGGRPWHTDALPLQPGHAANYPGGEVFVAPHRDGADGVLVADLTVPYTVVGLVDEPVTLRFEAGRVTSIEGGRAADLLRTIVARGRRGRPT